MHTASAGDLESHSWVDAHNHLHDPRLSGLRHTAGECLINATSEAEWPAVIEIATPPGRHPAIGIHPWFAHTAAPGWDDRLIRLLEDHPAASLGECGLDVKCRTCPLDVQLPVFIRQLAIAAALNRPITIHMVGAWGRLMMILQSNPRPRNLLFHGFNGSSEIARQLARIGAFFSISPRALHPACAKIFAIFETLPPDRILLESDAPNHPLDLSSHAPAIAARLGFTGKAFATLTRRNFTRLMQP